jgi:hypothetical protein
MLLSSFPTGAGEIKPRKSPARPALGGTSSLAHEQADWVEFAGDSAVSEPSPLRGILLASKQPPLAF